MITPLLGDNRIVGNHLLGQVDRVLMGYIPTPKNFLHRAFDFLKAEGGMIHYHHTCTKSEFRTLAECHIREELDSWRSEDPGEKDKDKDNDTSDDNNQNSTSNNKNNNDNSSDNGNDRKRMRSLSRLEIVAFRVVKSYSPKQFHCVADVSLS